jgi:hypothetical protein
MNREYLVVNVVWKLRSAIVSSTEEEMLLKSRSVKDFTREMSLYDIDCLRNTIYVHVFCFSMNRCSHPREEWKI